MPTSKNKKLVTISFDKNDIETFLCLYPDCHKEFCKRAIKKAAQNRTFFDYVFFSSDLTADFSGILYKKGE